MNLTKIIQELHQELQNVDETIAALSRLNIGKKRLGRPPAWLAKRRGKRRSRIRRPKAEER